MLEIEGDPDACLGSRFSSTIFSPTSSFILLCSVFTFLYITISSHILILIGRLLPALNVYLSSSSNTTNYCNSAALKLYKNALQSSYSWLLMCVFGRFWQINRLFWIWWLTQCDSAALIWTIKVLNWYKCLFRSHRHKQAVTLHTVNNCT